MTWPTEVGAELKVAGVTYRVTRHIWGQDPSVALEVENAESGDRFLVWSGAATWGRDVKAVLERTATMSVGLPKFVAMEDDGEDAVVVVTAPPASAKPFGAPAWRGASRDHGVRGLQNLTRALGTLHRCGAWLQGIQRTHLYEDVENQRLHLVAMPSLYVSNRPAVEAAWRDMRLIGELAFENFVEEEYPGGHEMAAMLQDRTALEGTELIFPGLPQVLAGCVSPYGDLAYTGADGLWEGLEQLRIELERPLEFRVGAASSVGNYLFRKNNQDSCGHIAFQSICGSRKVSLGFFCVADGIGGIQDGEKASRLAVETACEAFARGWAHYGASQLTKHPIEFARSVTKVVGQRLSLEGEFDSGSNRGGTTFSGMLIAGNRLGVCHVGDSRVMLVRDGRLVPLTDDHTLANILIRLGELDPNDEEANDVSQRTISRFLSTATEVEFGRVDSFGEKTAEALNTTIDQTGIEVLRGDLFILTSDGAHGEVNDDEMVVLSEEHRHDPQALCDAIVGLALERMGRDNATCLAVVVD